ncbi:RNA-guided endonuclease InsQ/TnpB family protein [Desulfurobacterium crinifex]
MKTRAEKIKQAIKETREKRKKQVCKVYQLKLQNLTDKDIERFNRLFLEAKWFYNYVIADLPNRLKYETYKLKEVEIKTPEGFERRELTVISSQMKQGILERTRDDLKALKSAKGNGSKVGKLNFKSEVNSIPLKQYRNTYEIFRGSNKVKIQGFKKKFRILGLHQIPENAEFANAYFVRKPSGFYIHVTCYLPKEQVINEIKEKQIDEPIGVDLGIKNQLTLSNGEKIRWQVPETKRLKRLQQSLARKKKGSKNYWKVLMKIKREYEYLTNKRKDFLKKAVAFLKRFKFIAIQDDSIKGWQEGLFGKQVHYSGIGGITARLRNLATLIPEMVKFVPRFEPTTQTCSRCGHRQKISLSQRVFKCEKCGLEIDRDINSALVILKLGLGAGKENPAV